MDTDSPARQHSGLAARAGLVAGITLLALSLLLPAPAGLSDSAWRTAGLALMMAIWWSTGPVPLGVTGLLPVVVLPLAGVTGIGTVTAAYGDPLVFLFLGGFLVAAGLQRWGLHRRIAHAIVSLAGTGPHALVLGFMMSSALLSMWISNTAAVILLLPVATSLITVRGPEADGHFASALLLGLAYGASIGGVGTLIGSPPNALMAGFLDQQGIAVSFAGWSALALPFVALFLPLAWFTLTRLVFPLRRPGSPATADKDLLAALRPAQGWSAPERRVAVVFLAMAALWVLRPWLAGWPPLQALSDPAIAIAGAIALFLIPHGSTGESGFLLDWPTAQTIPWQILLLFGGGLALAGAIDSSGLAGWIAGGLAAAGDLPQTAFVGLVAGLVVILTELASNTATVAALLPVVTAAASAAGHDVMAVSAAIAMAASCAFMLPVATPPNAIVFASGHLTAMAMIRAGLVLNIISVALVTLVIEVIAVLTGAL